MPDKMYSEEAHKKCAVHDLVIETLQDKISAIAQGQSEVKDLILNAHKESLATIVANSKENKQEIAKVYQRLEDEIEKFHERDRSYLIAIHKLNIKYAIITAGGLAVCTTITFLMNVYNVASKILH